MSEIVKVDGAWRIAKSQKAEFVKEYLVPYLRAQVSKRNLTGDDVSLAREGFGKIFIDGKEKGIQNVRRLFRTDKNPTLSDKEKTKVVKQDRSEGQYGFNKETQKQINFLDDVGKLKAEYAENSNDPNAGKIFDKKMSALFRKNYRGKIKYDPNKDYGWPEGKSLEGYKKWQRLVYNRLKSEDGDVIHVGHGKPVKQGGTNSASNLALEDAKSNVKTGSREGTFRSDQELENVYVAHGKSQSLQEYLAFEDDPNILTPMDLSPEDHASLLQDLDQDPEAIFAKGLDNRYLTTYNSGSAINVQSQSNFDRRKADLEAGYKRTDQVIEKEQEVPTAVKDFAQEAWDVGMDAVGLGAVKNTVRAGQAVINKDPVSALINVASIRHETIEPLAKRSEYKAITRDIAGK